MSAYLAAYPYLVLALGIITTAAALINGTIATLVIAFGKWTDEIGARICLSAIAMGVSNFCAVIVLSFMKWLLTP